MFGQGGSRSYTEIQLKFQKQAKRNKLFGEFALRGNLKLFSKKKILCVLLLEICTSSLSVPLKFRNISFGVFSAVVCAYLRVFRSVFLSSAASSSLCVCVPRSRIKISVCVRVLDLCLDLHIHGEAPWCLVLPYLMGPGPFGHYWTGCAIGAPIAGT